MRRWLCLQVPKPWLVGPGSPSGHWFWGLWVSGLFEKDPWSRIKVIYLRTLDRVSWSMKQGEERYRGSERGRVGWLKREPNKRGEELCVMSVFPCQSYFEMWLNSPPSVRLVYGLRAAKPPTERTWSWHIIAKTQAVYSLDVWIIFCIIKLFKKHKAKTICMDVMCLRWKIVSLSIKVNPYCLNFLQTKELVSLFLP